MTWDWSDAPHPSHRPAKTDREPAPTPTYVRGGILPLMGIHEIAQAYNVTRQRAHLIVANRTFPDPVAELAMGRVWREEDVYTWAVSRERNWYRYGVEIEGGRSPKQARRPSPPGVRPPATANIGRIVSKRICDLVVLVPVLNRPQNVAPLVESFLAHCPQESELCFIVTRTDAAELTTLDMEGCYQIPTDAVTWPDKINVGVKMVRQELNPAWYLLAADDIRFTPGWWEATAELRANPAISVIGTNDSIDGTGNPRVAAGEHTCHPLIRAEYIDILGTIDEPGAAVHGGYHHWFVDDELIWTAKYRQAWTYCGAAVVHHLHPYWDKTIPWDETYAAGEVGNEADRDLFLSRAHLFGVRVQ